MNAYGKIYEEKPVTIMVMAPINKTTKVEAKMSFYNTLAVALSNNGYYVFPSTMVIDLLKDQSAYDSELLVDKSMKVLSKSFGVDAVLFTTIHGWRKRGFYVEVEIQYLLKSAKTNEVLFDRKGVLTVSSSSSSGNVFTDLAVMAISTALTKEVTVADKCNSYAFDVIPRGKYSPQYGLDGSQKAGEQEFKIKLSQ